MMDGHPFRQETLIGKGNRPQATSNPTDNPTTRQAPAIAKTVAEARAGELLWKADPERNRYGSDGKYEGRGTWELVTVLEVGRLSVIAGSPTYPNSGAKYDRKTGSLRSRGRYNGTPYVRGSEERADAWWGAQGWRLAEKVKACRDVEVLKTITFALGLDGPPDFSVSPLPSSTNPIEE